jgi:hypothetical protein
LLLLLLLQIGYFQVWMEKSKAEKEFLFSALEKD